MTSNPASIFDGEPCYGCGEPVEAGPPRNYMAVRSGDHVVAVAVVHQNEGCQHSASRNFDRDVGPDRDQKAMAEEAIRTGSPPPPFRKCLPSYSPV